MRHHGACTNCGAKLEKTFVYQGVVICGDCFKMVSHTMQRIKKELQMLHLVYTDMVRASLIKGSFRPAILPAGEMPPAELTRAVQRLADTIGGTDVAHHRQKTEGKGNV